MMKRVIECQERILKLMLVFMLAITLFEIPVVKEAIQDPVGVNNIEALAKVPNIKQGTVTWEQYASIMIAGQQHTALSAGGKFLAQNFSNKAVTWDEATTQAGMSGYVNGTLGVGIASPESSILSSSLALKTELEVATEPGQAGILNRSIFENRQVVDWWTGDAYTRDGLKVAGVVTSNNELNKTGNIPSTEYQGSQSGEACSTRTYVYRGEKPRVAGELGYGTATHTVFPQIMCTTMYPEKRWEYSWHHDPMCGGEAPTYDGGSAQEHAIGAYFTGRTRKCLSAGMRF